MKKNIFIIILSVIVLCLGGYLVYDKLLLNDNNEEVVNKTEYDLAAAKSLVNMYVEKSFAYPRVKNIFEIGLTEDMKMFISYNETSSSSITNCESVYSGERVFDEKTNAYKVLDENNNFLGYCPKSVPSKSYFNVNESYKKMFGDSFEMPKKSFIIGYLGYDFSDAYFINLTEYVGGIDMTQYLYEVKSAKVDNNKLIIEVGYYKLLGDDEKSIWNCELNNKSYTYDEISSSDFSSKLMEEIMDKVDLYKFTFFEENGIYKLENMVRVK